MTIAPSLAQLQALDRALRRYGLLTQEVYASRFWGRDYDENEPDMRFLVDAECDVGQGFLLSRPLEADQVAPFIKRFLSQDYRAFLSAA